jgi:hypothetical protein
VGRLAGLVVLAAIFTFCLVQDGETSAGVGRYLTAQRAAMAGQGPRVTVDEIMGPANRLAVREGMAWSGRVAMAGLIGLLIYRRVRLKPDTHCPAEAGHDIGRPAHAGHYNEGPSWMT